MPFWYRIRCSLEVDRTVGGAVIYDNPSNCNGGLLASKCTDGSLTIEQ